MPDPTRTYHHRACQARLLARPALLLALLLPCACRRAPEAPPPTPPDLVRVVTDHNVTLTLTLSPGTMDPRSDVILSIQARFPTGVQIGWPDPVAALEGFALAATLTPPEQEDSSGQRIRENVLRLTPVPGAKYRIAPMLFSIRNGTEADAPPRYLITPALRPSATRNAISAAGATLTVDPEPLYIPPTPRDMLHYALLALLAIATLLGLAWLGRKLRRRIRIMMMSPSERARHELDELLARDLPAHGRFKEFYFAITAIVRTYIERQHGIRAPELTTPEFLAAAARRPDFAPAIIARLQRFLEAADLVKFAARTPTPDAIRDTIDTARDYLSEDRTDTSERGH